MFIHERRDWTKFHWEVDKINRLQLKAMHCLGYLAGRMASIGFDNLLKMVPGTYLSKHIPTLYS